jgi:putative glutamine amidotransferase
MPKAQRFTVGVQWHAEWKAQEHELASKLFNAFGKSAYEYAKEK